MSVFLILFLVAALGIVFLIGRKIFVLKHTDFHTPSDFNFLIEVPDFQEAKTAFYKKSRRYGYIALVLTIRLYVLTSHSVSKGSKGLWQWIKRKLTKKHKTKDHSQVENKFLTRISEYKKRIRRIKEKIQEEEGLN